MTKFGYKVMCKPHCIALTMQSCACTISNHLHALNSYLNNMLFAKSELHRCFYCMDLYRRLPLVPHHSAQRQ